MDLLKQLQADVVGRLASCPDFADVDIMAQEGTGEAKTTALRDRMNKVMAGVRKTNGRAGVGVLVEMPAVRIEAQSRDLPGPQPTVQIGLVICEAEHVNKGDKGTGKSAESLGFTALSLLHLFQSRQGMIFYAADDAMTAVEVDEEITASVSYQVTITTPLAVTPWAKAGAPWVSEAEGVCTIEAGPGDAVYYTIDPLAYPRAGDPAAVLYDGPFTVPPGTVSIRAAAYSYQPATVGSDVTELLLL